MRSSPIWLLWFTHADVIGVVLGLKVPDLSTKARFGRPGITLVLPDGTFEWRRLPDGAEDKWNAMARQHRRERLALPDNLTTRERRRVLRLTESAEVGEALHAVASPKLKRT
jgi:hypothetical protein